MNRKTQPKIRAFLRINRPLAAHRDEGTIAVRLENYGRVLAHHVMVELEVPININGLVNVEKPAIMQTGEDGTCWRFRLNNSFVPLFPGGDATLRKSFSTDVDSITDRNRRALQSTRSVVARVFADEMPAIHARLSVDTVLVGWAPVQNGTDSK